MFNTHTLYLVRMIPKIRWYLPEQSKFKNGVIIWHRIWDEPLSFDQIKAFSFNANKFGVSNIFIIFFLQDKISYDIVNEIDERGLSSGQSDNFYIDTDNGNIYLKTPLLNTPYTRFIVSTFNRLCTNACWNFFLFFFNFIFS